MGSISGCGIGTHMHLRMLGHMASNRREFKITTPEAVLNKLKNV